jgi:uncharacterized OsmC-like protein
MYRLSLDDGNQLHVTFKNHTLSYGQDGSLPNPLEATYAALAGCAGVYSRKACKAMQISAEGIEIDCTPVVSHASAVVPLRFVTEVCFPDRFSPLQRQKILEEINHCAVKRLMHEGSNIDFVTREALAV